MSGYRIKYFADGMTALYDGQFILAIAAQGENIVEEAELYIQQANLSDEEKEALRDFVSLA